ncbi:MAG: hypothetical protein A4E57_02476 [Syntrophorhabdaceae bacterium PtaU1.Bin034]|nr:MAG: hypothetical protein A4E57_02476 [Syntrophorhabdaceae bacterium PtaU1.Bin034]
MKKKNNRVSIKMSDAERQRLDDLRGNQTISDFLRGLLFQEHTAIKHEAEALQQLIADVALIRVKLSGTSHAIHAATPAHVKALAAYLAEIVRLGNPPAYAGQADTLKALSGRLLDALQEAKS